MALQRYVKPDKDWVKKLDIVDRAFKAVLPKRAKGMSGIPTVSFLMVPLALFGLAVIFVPYAVGFGLIYKLKVFPFPIFGVMIIAAQTVMLFYSIVIRFLRRHVIRHRTEEGKYIGKLIRERAKKYPWAHDAFWNPQMYNYTPYTLDIATRKEYYTPTSFGNVTSDYQGLLKSISAPYVMRETAGMAEFLPKEPVISKYRAQVWYSNRPKDYIAYYVDSYGPEVAEKCLRDFLEKTRDMTITDCYEDSGLTLVQGIEHEVYIDFYSAETLGIERHYVADGTVDYDYSGKGIA